MRSVLLALILVFSASAPNFAQLSPPKLKAVIMVKIAELETKISKAGNDVSIHVIGAPELAKALEEFKGKNIGEAKLTQVTHGDGLPAKRVDILFVGSNNGLKDVIHYARSNKVMTVTDRADIFQKGLSVSILTEKRRPKISLSPGPSLKEGLDWNLDFTMFQSLTLEFKKTH